MDTEEGTATKTDGLQHNGHDVKEKSQSCSRKWRRAIRQNLVMILTLVGICVGFGLGLAVRELNPSDDAILWIGMPGDLYMRLLKMTILPLVTCSVIAGAATLDPKTSGKIGTVVVILVALTHVLAGCLSTGLVLLIKPGGRSDAAPTRKLAKAMKTHDVFADLLRNLVPDSIVGSAFRQTVTKYELDESSQDKPSVSPLSIYNMTMNKGGNGTSDVTRETTHTNNEDVDTYTRVVSYTDGINVLGLITISAVFGIAAGKIRSKVPVFLAFVENVLQLVLIIVRWFFWLTPIGVLSLIAKSMTQVDNLADTFSDLGLFVVTIVTGLVIHWVIVLPAIYLVVVRKNPLNYFLAQFSAVSIAFAATASTIAMPEMFHICENKFNMDKRLTKIAIPLCTTLNADGSAMFIIAAAMFITDYSGVDMTANNVIVTLVLGIVSSMAIPGVPSSSIFTIIIILTAINVPLQNVAILFAMEWLLDRIRTGVNLVSHMTIVACTNSLCKKNLREMDDMAAANGDLPVTRDKHGGGDDGDNNIVDNTSL